MRAYKAGIANQRKVVMQMWRLTFALRELALTLADWWQAGDLGGHLRAWGEVVTRKVVTE